MKNYVVSFLLLAGVVGCTEKTADNAATERRIALCQEVMKSYIVEANIHKRDQKRIIGTCHMAQKERTEEQWRCALDSMRKGEAYDAASDKCGKTNVLKAK